MQALIQQQAPTVAPAFDWKTRILTVTAGALLSASLFAQTPQTESDSMASRMIIELQQMREEMRELRGLVEAQTQEIENLKRRQRDQYLDLDARIGELSSQPTAQAPMPQVTTPVGTMPANTALQVSGTPPERVQSPPPPQDLPEVRDPVNTQAEIITLNAPSSASVREMQPPTEAEQQAYDQAFLALRETRYADAAEGFDRFLRDHPNSSYAPNAQYWLGEVYYVTRDFDTALGQFERLLGNYPDSSKEADALLKIGFSQYELQQWPEARAALEQVVSDYPGTNFSRLAENRLRTMRLEGHF